MKKIYTAFFSILLVNSLFSQTAQGEDTPATPPAIPDSATMMKNWATYMTPGAMHKMMAGWDGTWNADITMWMQPGAPPQKTKAKAVNKMIMNGLYQESVHSGNMMGMAFNGKSTLGYDNLRKVFVSTWIDNMGSGIMYMEGPISDAGKEILLKGKMTDPGTGAITDVRETFRLVNEDTQVMEMFVSMPGMGEMKTMEIKFVRVKG